MLLKFSTGLLIACIIFSCDKSYENMDVNTPGPITATSNISGRAILIDASRDGGVWWYPQWSNFSSVKEHQGKPLAEYLRSLDYTVDELPRGASITWEKMQKYKLVIRAGGFGNYTANEIAAYDSLLHRSSSLLLLNDHLQNFPNDQLSAHLGLDFSGSYTGTLTPSSNHIINTGVSVLPYTAGSVILNPDPAKMSILGYVRTSSGSEAYAAMGILHHPNAKIFFIGDANGIEQLPQPFTSNLVSWLLQ